MTKKVTATDLREGDVVDLRRAVSWSTDRLGWSDSSARRAFRMTGGDYCTVKSVKKHIEPGIDRELVTILTEELVNVAVPVGFQFTVIREGH